MELEAVNGKSEELQVVERPLASVSSGDDNADMNRMGKKQELVRNFRYLSITAFTVIAQGNWLYSPNGVFILIANGGTGGIIWLQLLHYVFYFFITLSLAEMASIAPTAGGQYHWASEFAPPSMQKFLSYIAGWLSALAWIASATTGLYLCGYLIIGMVSLTHPAFVSKPYQGYLLVVLITCLAVAMNTTLPQHLPKIEGLVAVYTVLAYATILVVLWVLGEKLTASEVFFTFTGDAGWSSLGLNLMAIQGLLASNLVGADCAAHMAEETRHANTVVPKAMISAYLISGAAVLIMQITFCFCLTNIDNDLLTTTGFPFLQAFADTTGSNGGAIALTSLILVALFFGVSNYMASCSRQVFAFARDKGLPFHQWISHIDKRTNYPFNAIVVVAISVLLISVIGLGSPYAFNAIASLFMFALIFTYTISIACLVWRRMYGEPLPPANWPLGRAGMWINVVSLAYCGFLLVLLPWPQVVPVTANTFNWAIVMWAIVMILSMGYYFLRGRHTYDGPVAYVRKRY